MTETGATRPNCRCRLVPEDEMTPEQQLDQRARRAFTMWAQTTMTVTCTDWDSLGADEQDVWRDLITEHGRPLPDRPKVTVNVAYLLDRGLWERACALTGWLDVKALEEGRMGEGDEVPLTVEQARELGIFDLEES